MCRLIWGRGVVWSDCQWNPVSTKWIRGGSSLFFWAWALKIQLEPVHLPSQACSEPSFKLVKQVLNQFQTIFRLGQALVPYLFANKLLRKDHVSIEHSPAGDTLA